MGSQRPRRHRIDGSVGRVPHLGSDDRRRGIPSLGPWQRHRGKARPVAQLGRSGAVGHDDLSAEVDHRRRRGRGKDDESGCVDSVVAPTPLVEFSAQWA